MNVRQGLFGSRPNGAEQSPRPYRPSAPYPPAREEAAPLMGRVGRMETAPRRSVPPPSQYGGAPRGRGDPSRKVSLRIAKVEDKTLANQFIFGNKCAVSPQDFPEMEENTDFRLLLNGNFILTARSLNSFQPGCISLSDPQRTWLSVGLMDTIVAEYYDPRHESSNYLLGYTELEVGFASLKKVTDVPLDQDDLEARFLDQFDGQFLTVGQKIIMDYKSLLLSFVVKACDVVPVMLEDKTVTKDKGKLNSKTHITFFKDAKSILKLKGSAKRPATNSIVGPNFKFENMGIGGLDKEFSQLFRRAFASRVFPPDVIQDMGIQHVKGILLYGPPGTGKTLIARQIGKMLNAREPKIINGPEVLNKFVGQSEENIRKLFADAEKEYKEKGDESGLHIIIFDELDAVCKQRGSGAGGGTGVGDSVVNQLLSKLDGVEPLNNILLIGMTNRKDMIDDALLRPGRIEVQLEIMLPDEFGRQQILKIHLAKMVASKVLGDDVDVEDLAARTKNFSGAEIAGLVKSASSYALNRHIVVGTQAQIDDNLADIKVTYNDFNEALKEVKPAFGRADESLEKAAPHGIIHFAPHIQKILDRGNTQIASLKRAKKGTSVTSLLLYGPRGSGRTAMASRIAGESGFPFIKYVNAGDLLGMADAAKADYVKKAFTDAYRSPQSVIILDDIERIISWVRIGPLFSSGVVQTLMVQLSISPPTGHSLLIIGTTEERYALQQLDLVKYFTLKFEIPYITRYDELISFLRDDEAFGNDEAREDAVVELRERLGSRQLAVGVKQVIDAVDLAIATGGNTARGFAENLLGQVDVLGQGED